MQKLFSNLPKDIINKILDYNQTIKYRNGKYINQICNIETKYYSLSNNLLFNNYRRYLKMFLL